MNYRLRFAMEEIVLAEGETVVGRDESCVITLADDFVSRTHAAFKRQNGVISVRDLGSRNGTFVNGHRITTSMRLRDGDRIKIGPREIVFYEVRRFPGQERVTRDTGELIICDGCSDVLPAEVPLCSRCGAKNRSNRPSRS